MEEHEKDSKSINSITLYGTDSLCFDKNDFMKGNFNADTFVQIHQASGSGGLETLRDDLGIYLKILRSAMIDLINRDYADFVNLSTNLTGLDRLIETLKAPLIQLREEVLSVERLIGEAVTSISENLERRATITKQKALLHRINQISIRLERLENLLKCGSLENSDLNESPTGNDLVNRLATEVNHLNFLVSQCEGAALLDVFRPRVESVCNFVEVGLERGLREGIEEKDTQLLVRTLRTYASLGTIDHAHQQVRSIIQAHLEEVISDAALKSDPRGLRGMFEKTIVTIKTVFSPLLTVSMGTSSDVVAGFSFLEKSVWPDIVYGLETRTQHIFNPGNPDAFHVRYLESVKFLDQFEELLETTQRVVAFRKESDYKKFWDQWNLPVYFQIRYQEIGQVMESSISDDNRGLTLSTVSDFKLEPSHIVWESLQKCFNSEVFLLPLLHRFWKLVLLILSRYRTWVRDTTAAIKSSKLPDGRGWLNNSELPRLHAALYLLSDVNILAGKLENFYDSTILVNIEHLSQEKKNVVIDTIKQQIEKLISLRESINDSVISALLTSMGGPLKQVTETPRIYRRTNKSLPSTNQQYIASALLPLIDFNSKAKETIASDELRFINQNVIASISTQYESVTREVLVSVQKMEESLRRLKRARDRGQPQGGDASGLPTDDDKIRAQIHLDVVYFGEKISELGLDVTQIESYGKLLKMAQDAKEAKMMTN